MTTGPRGPYAAKSVYEELRRDIVAGHFEPGSPLVETSLAAHYGVSRTPVREAMLQLLRDGLVERSGRGLSVAAHSPEEILHIYEVRILLEGAAARWAGSRRTELDLSRLARAHDDMLRTGPDESALKKKTNTAFHEQLWAASHNPTLIEVLQRIIVHIQRFPETTLDYPGRWESILQEHTELIEAIRAGDADAAEDIATRHMTTARAVWLDIYATGYRAAKEPPGP